MPKSNRIPFSSYFRLFFHLYLILPQTQGAKHLYITYLEPWLEENENDIDMFIASAHERLRSAGMTYLKFAIEWARVNILHLPPDENLNAAAAAPPPAPESYTANLLGRFALPGAKSAVQAGGDFYSVLANAVSSATGLGGGAAAASATRQDMTASGTLIPKKLREAHPREQLSFLSAQRERLQILMGALDQEAASLQVPGAFSPELAITPGSSASGSSRPTSGLGKSRSEQDFEKIDAESGAEEEGVRMRAGGHVSSGSSWMPWGGSGGAGRSTGVDPSD